jgi:hypothetical protein
MIIRDQRRLMNESQRKKLNQARLEEEEMTVTQFSDDCWWNWFESFFAAFIDWFGGKLPVLVMI